MHKLASLLLTLSATTAFVQAENIKGTVVDKVTKEPLIGATIQVAGTTMGTITDFDGKFELPELENKSYTLIISYVSYQTQEIPGGCNQGTGPGDHPELGRQTAERGNSRSP